MEIKGKVHCFFEQSGTFKNEFIKLGIPAEDYDKVEEALRKLWDKDHHPVRSKLIELFSKKID